jgi:endonuclease/exonuclease/phosphatase family metal-dependent hydrolase
MLLRILSYNIRRGGSGREDALATVIAAADVDLVVLQEATRPDVVARLARVTGFKEYAASSGRSLAFLSRVSIDRHRWVRPRFSQHAFLEIVPAGLNVRIIGVHLSAVHAAWTERRRVHELRGLLAELARNQTSAHLVVGDFNTLAPDEHLDLARLPRRLRFLVWLSGGRIRWQTIAIMLGAGYSDAFRTRHAGDAGATFPTWDPHIRLDYAFISRHHTAHVTACDVLTEGAEVRRASDHLPLRVELSMEDESPKPAPLNERGEPARRTIAENHRKEPL